MDHLPRKTGPSDYRESRSRTIGKPSPRAVTRGPFRRSRSSERPVGSSAHSWRAQFPASDALSDTTHVTVPITHRQSQGKMPPELQRAAYYYSNNVISFGSACATKWSHRNIRRSSDAHPLGRLLLIALLRPDGARLPRQQNGPRREEQNHQNQHPPRRHRRRRLVR